MKIDLVRPSRPRIVRYFVLENDVDTIVHVSANDQRKLLFGILANFGLFLVQHKNHSDRVDNRGGFRRRRLEGNRQRNGMNRVELARRIFRTQTPRPLLARLGLLRASRSIFAYTERFQPRCSTMIRREGRPLPKMWTQPGEREFPGLRIERNCRTLQRGRRLVVRPLVWRLRLVERLRAVPLPIHHRRVMRLGLLHLIFRLARQPLRRQHVLDPILD